MAIETTRYDPVDYLETPEGQIAYLEAAFEDGHPIIIAKAIGNVARARGITGIARETGLTRPALYKAFGDDGNPTLSTLSGVLKVLGLRLSVQPIGETAA